MKSLLLAATFAAAAVLFCYQAYGQASQAGFKAGQQACPTIIIAGGSVTTTVVPLREGAATPRQLALVFTLFAFTAAGLAGFFGRAAFDAVAYRSVELIADETHEP